MKAQNNKTTVIAVIGIAAVIGILLFGTLWSSRNARVDTETAVHHVSLLYLDELAGRREQVVEENLNRRIRDLHSAIELMTPEDLADAAHLRGYQAKMKKLYELEKFAFVDTSGLIYTSNGTQTNIDDYVFDHRNLSGPEISVLNDQSEDKKVIIAVPVDPLSLEGEDLVICFMEIGMDEMLQGVSMRSGKDDVTFCNLYTSRGTALSNMILGGQASETDLLEAMEHAVFDPGYSYEKVKSDFLDGVRGQATFTYDGVRETLSYVPVTGTDWLLTYLVREDVISEQISSISSRLIRRSLIQSILMAAVLLAMFTFIIRQNRQNAQLQIDKETTERANRIRQAELEQRLALQEKLLEQESLRARQDNMITALSSDYRSVYYVNLDRNEAVCYRNDQRFEDAPAAGESFPYLERFESYARRHVAEGYLDGFLAFIQPENIRTELLSQPVIAYRFQETRDGAASYSMLRMADVRQSGDRPDNTVHAIGVAFSDIDAEMRKAMTEQQAISDALATAEQANRAKTSFLSSMSHEIRTPMNAIIGLDSLALRNADLPEETRSYLEKIGESARHLLGLINDILDMSRIESGRLVLHSEAFSFRSMLEQINTMVMSQCGEKGLEYDCSVIGGIDDHYIGDVMKLKQVLINILSNAIKFTEAPGKVTLSVERTAAYEDQVTLRFVVRDTGIGMDPAYLPRIFDAFSQENSDRNSKYGSTGLGMAITKNIVTLMNGTISVESEKGVGTAFTVVVPLKKHEQGDLPVRTIDPRVMRVLVVDDEEIAAEHARIVLDEAGIRADICLSGPEALDRLAVAQEEKRPYNLVLLDWKMPEMDGLEVARRIRALYDKDITVVILTSFNWDEIMDEALHIGVDGFLSKPLFASAVMDEFERAARKNNMALFREKERAELKDRRILLAEDIMINAEIMKQLLLMKGAIIDHAENGRIAVDMFRQSDIGCYDAILMDVRMPEMDGLEAASAIRALDRPDALDIPIIALTANAFDEDVQRSLQAGMNAHLSKPVEPERLYQTLEELIWEADQKRND